MSPGNLLTQSTISDVGEGGITSNTGSGSAASASKERSCGLAAPCGRRTRTQDQDGAHELFPGAGEPLSKSW